MIKIYKFEIFTVNAANHSVYLILIHSSLTIDITMILSTYSHDGICNTSTSPWVVAGVMGGQLVY